MRKFSLQNISSTLIVALIVGGWNGQLYAYTFDSKPESFHQHETTRISSSSDHADSLIHTRPSSLIGHHAASTTMPMGHLAALKREDPLFKLDMLHLEYLNHPFEPLQFDRRTKEKDTKNPTTSPSANPTMSPSENPTTSPSESPSMYPTIKMKEPLRIVYETSNIEKKVDESPYYKDVVNTLTQNILPKVSQVWSSILSIVPVEGNITVHSKTCYGFFDVPEPIQQRGVSDTDLLIFVSGYNTMNNITFCDDNVLASASHCVLDQYDRPVVGFVNFCLDNINIRNEYAAVAVGVHELAHVLGFSDDLFQYFRDGITGDPLTPRPFKKSQVVCVNGSKRKKVLASENVLQQRQNGENDVYYEIVSPKVLDVARNHFGCPNLTGARLENQPTRRSCTGAHLDERYYFTDSMSPIFSSESVSILSPITVALMEDTGWYGVTYTSRYIKNNPFGLGAGCDFLQEDSCIRNDTVPEKYQPYFCDTVTKFDNDGKVSLTSASTCDPSFSHVAYCDLVDFSTNLPDKFTTRNGGWSGVNAKVSKFSDPDLGTMLTQSDSCPIASLFAIDCTNPSTPSTKKLYPEEYYGSGSRCFNSNFGHPVHSEIPRGVCLKSRCNQSDRTLEVYFGKTVVTCKHDGEVHHFPQSTDVSFTCPPLSSFCPQLFCPAMCSGNGVCNFEKDPPVCECYDENDRSPGCFGVDVGAEFGVDFQLDDDGYNSFRDRDDDEQIIGGSNGGKEDPSSGLKLAPAWGIVIVSSFMAFTWGH